MLQKLYTAFLLHKKVSTDSRNVMPGDIFFALKGPYFDAHNYVKEVLQKGVSYAVIDNPTYFIDERTILVENTLSALQTLANMYRKSFDIPVLVVAGSNGKTTTKELIFKVLSKKYKAFATKGNLNNHIGVPLTLLSMPKDIEVAIIEIGANHRYEHTELCQIVQPTLGLVTNNGKDHLEGFGSIEGVVQANNEVYEYFKGINNHCIFVHGDDEVLMEKSANYQRFTYGKTQNNNIIGRIISNAPYLQLAWKEREKNNEYLIQSKIIGTYNFSNILCAISVGTYMGVNPEDICLGISEYEAQNNRSQWIEHHNIHIMLDAYNANPSSMQHAIESFLELPMSSKWLILGDMAELGAFSDIEHKHILDYILSHKDKIDQCVLYGSNFGKFKSIFPFHFFSEKQDVIRFLKENIKQGDAILVKGSRSAKMEEIIYSLYPTLKDLGK